jgi:hypothetical protein
LGSGWLILGLSFWQNIVWQYCISIFIHLEHELYCFLKSSGFINVVPLGMVKLFKEYILSVYNLCRSFCMLFRWVGVSLCFCSFQLFPINVHVVGKVVSKLRIWTLFSLSSTMVWVVGEYRHAAILICISMVNPLYLAIVYFVSLLYMVPSLPKSFNVSLSCSPMHFRYAFLKEKASVPNSLCGSCVARFGVLFGTLHIALVTAMICLSSFLIFGIE